MPPLFSFLFIHYLAGGVFTISRESLRINEQIHIREVRVTSATGEQLGIMPTREALRMAEEQHLDLVEVALRESDVLLELLELVICDIALYVRDDIASFDVFAVSHDEFGDRAVRAGFGGDERAGDLRVIDIEIFMLMLVIVNAAGTEYRDDDEAWQAVFHQVLYFFCDINFQD